MTDLSPAAQAVLDAIQDELDATAELVPCNERIAAAVLRAAAEQIETLYCDSDVNDSPGIVFALRQLMLIANELEQFDD